jgi:beta-galactosidase
VPAKAAIIYDWEVNWAIESMLALGSDVDRRGYWKTALSYYAPLWKRGIPTDVIPQDADLGQYKLIVAPMLYMLKPDTAEHLRNFVSSGGTLVMTYWSGLVDETDLCFLGGCPGEGLNDVLGIWDEETDTLALQDRNQITMDEDNEMGISGHFEVKDYCALIHARGATVLATYAADFYQGMPALTINHYGAGRAYYVAARTAVDFNERFIGSLVQQLVLESALPGNIPEGVSTSMRVKGNETYRFVMNFNPFPVSIDLEDVSYQSVLNECQITGNLELPAYGLDILK